MGQAIPSPALFSVDDARYAAHWARSPDRSPFSHPAALAAFAQAFGLPVSVLAVEAGGEWTAAVPVFKKKKGPFVASALPPLCPVHRPLLAAPLAEAETHARTSPLDNLLSRLDGETDQATLALGAGDLRPYLWAGWTVTPRSTYRLDLADDVEAGFSSSTRRTIRKESGAFECVEDPALASEAVRLMLASYARQGSDLGLSEPALVGLAEALQDAGLARTFAARRGGTTEAAIIAATDEHTAFYWIAGSEPGPAMTVLLAHTLRQLAEDGVETFDFVGANTPSIAEFKRRFGPTLAPAPLARRVSHPALRVVYRVLER